MSTAFYSSYEMVLVQLSAMGKELNRSRVLIQSISEIIAISTAEFLYPSHEGWSIVAHMQPIPVADYEFVLETADVTVVGAVANNSGFPSLNV